MALPNPLPDNPLRWEGWRNYNSDNFYERLCLSYGSNPNPEQIEDNCRQLLVWWQKKLPLKNQPSNPIAQILRTGLDEAPKYLAEARTLLLDADARARIDVELHALIVEQALGEFKKLLSFALGDNKLHEVDEQRLYERGRGLGLSHDDMKSAVDHELSRLSVARVATVAPAPIRMSSAGASGEGFESRDPFDEFRRMLRFSKLCLDGDDMTDDQRDALCNMGESLGLTGGQAEDLIDEYLEAASTQVISPPAMSKPVGVLARPAVLVSPAVPVLKKPEPAAPARPVAAPINISPLAVAQERKKHPNFQNSIGAELLLVTSTTFGMGSAASDAAPHEQPVTQVTLGCFYMARHPVTNAQYELFNPAHRAKRAPWADERHPVVHVSSREAEKFCQRLSAKEGRKYRLPTEAEWELAARGTDGRAFPWGEVLDSGAMANFADLRTTFAWRDTVLDDGFAETAPLGSYPRGVSPFGVEDLAGNVFEWCLDFFDLYKGKECSNRRGPTNGTKRIYRGGSWKSRMSNLRATARNFNLPDYQSNDVGFRVVCECEA